MIFKPKKPNEATVKWAYKISEVAHKPWSSFIFFILFFLDAFIMFIPADGIIAVTVLFAQDKKRPWFLASIAGAFLGFFILMSLTLSQFQPFLIEL